MKSFLDWLWHALAVAPNPVVYAGGWLLAVGAIALVWVTVGRKGNVDMGTDPVPPPVPDVTPTAIIPAMPCEPNWRPLAEVFPLADTHDLTPQIRAVQRYLERTETTVTVVREVVVESMADPLAVELKALDPTAPLFHGGPPPYHLEPFTRGWTREQVAAVLEAGRAEQ